jgi:hypothetical protein
VRRDTGASYQDFLTKLAQASGIETPTRADLARIDRKRKKKGSNNDWTHPHDSDAKITKMKDGRTHLAHKAEQAVDLETGAVVGVTVQDADDGDTETSIETLIEAAEQVEAVQPDGNGIEEIVGDKGYHSNQSLVDLEAVGVRSYFLRKGDLPVSISYRIAPQDQMSAWTPTGSPRACSGLIYAGVPITKPVRVGSIATVSAFAPSALASALARPKAPAQRANSISPRDRTSARPAVSGLARPQWAPGDDRLVVADAQPRGESRSRGHRSERVRGQRLASQVIGPRPHADLRVCSWEAHHLVHQPKEGVDRLQEIGLWRVFFLAMREAV